MTQCLSAEAAFTALAGCEVGAARRGRGRARLVGGPLVPFLVFHLRIWLRCVPGIELVERHVPVAVFVNEPEIQRAVVVAVNRAEDFAQLLSLKELLVAQSVNVHL
eukprot:CAMPEP_0171679160 /NCGR_PEP_ID=MMETSP0990-20121206/56078_1 /TAXON_ID=483369 /ORGANISM="non described non described, Strain CCMP2098" /LENGTH=105 /DNA_ID=CAMNT_0012265905 /DNA_START=101 /DNA_END=415 /DNA_ORIENTATION=+